MKEPTTVKEVKFEYIAEYVKEKGKDDIQWLKDLYAKPVPPDKNGKERSISFIEIRGAFIDKYMPHLKPIAKPKKPTMKELLSEL